MGEEARYNHRIGERIQKLQIWGTKDGALLPKKISCMRFNNISFYYSDGY